MPRKDIGVRAIIAYKYAKAAVQLGGALLLLVLLPLGLTEHVRGAIVLWRLHLARSWSLRASDWILRHATERWLELAILALMLDGAVSALEGWSLRRGAWWGPWLVVAATSSLVPFEVHRLVTHPSAVRVVVIVVNVAIVVYLALHARRAISREDGGRPRDG
jgi:uncharacterized membrane protein (DUF2068 family)